MIYIALAAAAVLMGVDQLTKLLIDTNMLEHDSFSILKFGDTEVLNITYVHNTGAAFSILEGKQIFLIIITLIILAAILFFMITKRVKRVPYIWCMALILAGGFGNLIDRVFRGFVIDFIDVRIINFAIFNVADICAVVGAFGLLLFVILDEIKNAKEKKKAAVDATDSKEEEES